MRFTAVWFRRWVLAVSSAALMSCVGCVPKRPVGTPLTQNAGAALFQSSGCSHCHAINGLGGRRGPELTHVGARLTQDEITKQIVEGGGGMPAYNNVLSPHETTAVVRYLHKLR